MAFVPVPNTIGVDVIFLLDNQRVENTLYFEKADGWVLADITTFMSDLATLINTGLMPLLSSALSFIELAARLLDTASSIGYTLSLTPPTSGGQADEALPSNVTYTIQFKTGLTGRSFRGRNYVPGLTIDSVTQNTIDTDTRTGLLAFYSSLRAMASENATPWVVVSKYSGVNPTTGRPIPRVTGVTTEVTSVSTFDRTLDSQRRRLPGRGN